MVELAVHCQEKYVCHFDVYNCFKMRKFDLLQINVGWKNF